MLTHTKQHIHDLFGLGMVNGFAVRNLMFLICLGSLVQAFEYCGETEGITGPNLIGRSTSNELVTEVGLVLGALMVLQDPDAINTTQYTLRSLEGQTYLTVSPSMLVVVAVPAHDDGSCKVCV
jgi:hypothetical protein